LLYPWLIYKKEHLTYLASGKKKSTEDQDKIKEVKDKENLFTDFILGFCVGGSIHILKVAAKRIISRLFNVIRFHLSHFANQYIKPENYLGS
jgi:hypothetical protein